MNRDLIGQYRVRQNWLGQCVLQRCYESPAIINGRFDASRKEVYWADVDYKHAPALLLVADPAKDILP